MKVATGRFGDKLRAIYERLGYEVIVLPRVSVEGDWNSYSIIFETVLAH
jgi:predicted ATPase